MDGEKVGDRIRKLRDQKEWTQEKLAQASGISKGFLSDVENGKRSISAANVVRIANALNASLEYLLRGAIQTGIAPGILVEIPPELSQAAEQLNLSYDETLTLLRTHRSIVAARSAKGKRKFDIEDWKKLYTTLKAFPK